MSLIKFNGTANRPRNPSDDAIYLDTSANILYRWDGNSYEPLGALSTLPAVGIGYATGAGAAVTQITNRSTGVEINAVCGTITTHNASLAAEAAAKFTVTNSAVAIGDVVVVSQRSGSNGGNTAVNVVAVAAGSFDVQVSNNNAAAGTAETGAIIINFAVIKAVAA